MTYKTCAVVAVKGGVGKTTCSINIARRLRDKYAIKVGLIDADFDNSNFAQFTNAEGEIKIVDGKEYKLYDWDGIKVFSLSLIAGRKRSVSMTGDRYAQMLSDALKLANWGGVEVFIVDLPSGSSDVFRSVMQLFGDTVIGDIVVTQPSMIDALNRVFSLHSYFEIPVVGVIENMAYYECTECHTKHYPFGHGHTQEIAQEYGADIIGELPVAEDIAEKMVVGEAILDEQYMPTIDAACERIISAQVVKTGIFKKFKSAVSDSVQGVIENVIAKLLMMIANDKTLDFKEIRRDTGFTDRKIGRLTITTEDMAKELTHVDMRMEDTGIKVVAQPKNIDYEFVMDFRTLSRIILRQRKTEDNVVEPFDPMDAWLNGDVKTYGEGLSTKVAHAFKGIFMDDQIMGHLADSYHTLLSKFI